VLSEKGVLRRGVGWGMVRSFACALLICLAASSVPAQTYNPYLAGQSTLPAASSAGGMSNGQNNLGSSGSDASSLGYPSTSGYQTTQSLFGGQVGSTGQNMSGATQFDPSGLAGSSVFSPATLSPGLPPPQDFQLVPYVPTAGQNPGPLYVRPGQEPGEFALFEKPPPELNEFEKFVKDQVGEPLDRFGSMLLLKRSTGFVAPPTATVPPDYELNPGDQLDLGFTGSVEANLRLVIDNEGRIFIPKIGAVKVAGVRYGDLAAAIQRRIDTQYRHVTVSVDVSHLHGITVYVTGFATTPGSYTMSSLSTMIDAVLTAGGPAAGGSYRIVELRRNGQLISTLDLYELLFNGDKSHDAVLQNEDVLNVAPVGPELAVLGSVNQPAIFEAKPGETLADVLKYAGGFDSVADSSRIILRSLSDLDTGGSRQLVAALLPTTPAQRGDIVRVLSLARVARPQERDFILATIEGEVDHPGRYFLPPGSQLSDLLARAGGLTEGAFTYGTVVERVTIKTEEQASFDQALSNLQLSAAAIPLQSSQLTGGSEGATARSQGALAIIERLKNQKPDGRLVLNILPDGPLPAHLALENSDRIFIPPRPKTVGVFGAVYRSGSFLYEAPHRIGDYIALAGGPQRIADKGDVFVVRANGSVISQREVHDLAARPALPGDVVFVPVRATASLSDKLIAAADIIFRAGLTAATLLAIGL